tara:strand:- start:3301 stop:3918 length:618 start_codon:yes stop_codon:yes gene_type:complete
MDNITPQVVPVYALSNLTPADYFLLAIILLSGGISLFRGFIREVISLLTWVVAVWLALHFSDFFVQYLTGYVNSPGVRLAISVLLVLIITLVGGMIVSQILTQLIRFSGLSGLDRFFGLFFGLGRGFIIVALLLVLANTAHMNKENWWKQSLVVQQFKPAVEWASQWLPSQMDKITQLVWPHEHVQELAKKKEEPSLYYKIKNIV